MAEAMFGEGVTVVSASYTGDSRSSGTFKGGDAKSPEITPSDEGVILSTGHVKDFSNQNGKFNKSPDTSTDTSGPDADAGFFSDPAFVEGFGTNSFDATYIDVDFIPDGDMLTMQFVFASEEYPEFSTSLITDSIGIWVNGSRIDVAAAPDDTLVDDINSLTNPSLFVDNESGIYNTEMDGFTVTLTAKLPVTSGELNSIRIGIADVGDADYDSSLLVAGNSIQSAFIANDDDVELFVNQTKNVDLVANDDGPGTSTIFITQINGQDVVAGDTVVLATGQSITLNADGTVDITADGDIETTAFTYTAAIGGGNGLTDTAFVTIDTVPCFVSGTLIRTARGDIPVERLTTGDMVLTRDDGAQPIRWIGRRTMPAEGKMAPVEIARGAFGDHGKLRVSPLHRILIRNVHAELLFGDSEVLIAARDLVDGRNVQQLSGGTVEYVHLLFDRHQVIWSEGLQTESFLPGPQTTHCFEAETVAEICEVFPELDPLTGDGYGPAARRTLRAFEARLLVA